MGWVTWGESGVRECVGKTFYGAQTEGRTRA
jgi:hypothetical protein